MARVFIVHRWDGTPKADWYAWLAGELEARGHTVVVPALPNTSTPKIGPWLKKLKATVGVVRPGDVFVGHSIGCQTVMRFLSAQKKKCAGALLVAGFMTPMNFSLEETDTVFEWLYPAFDPATVKSRAKNWRAIFSSNDPWVDGSINGRIFERALGAKALRLKKRGHFNEATLPEALAELKAMGL